MGLLPAVIFTCK